MTILANEIHIGESITDVTLIQVADKRITVNGKFHSNSTKIFKIPYLKASVGYFGLAQPNEREYFSSWLPNVIRNGYSIKSIGNFSEYLEDELGKKVSGSLLRNNPSGFHLCGLAEDGIPEFYFIRNFLKMENGFYKDCQRSYYSTEDFRNRDAIRSSDGNIRQLSSLSNCIFWYANGDLRTFSNYWEPLTLMIDTIAKDAEFPKLNSDLERAKWKLDVLAGIYEKFARKKTVGGSIDGIKITNSIGLKTQYESILLSSSLCSGGNIPTR